MHLPAASPPLRGLLLRLLARVTAVPALRDLLLWKVRRDAGIPSLPNLSNRPDLQMSTLPNGGAPPAPPAAGMQP